MLIKRIYMKRGKMRKEELDEKLIECETFRES